MATIYSRSKWGARYEDSYRNYTAALPKRWGYLHHSVTAAPSVNASFEQDAAAIRHVEQIGENRFGWGISYSFLIPPSGRVFHGHRVNGVGTHTHGYNSSTLAICFIGNYEDDEPTEAQLNSAAWLLGRGKELGWTTDDQLDGGHRDLKATACPGRHAYAQIAEINRRATEEEDMPLSNDDVRKIWTTDGIIPNHNATNNNKYWAPHTHIAHIEDTQDKQDVLLKTINKQLTAVRAELASHDDPDRLKRLIHEAVEGIDFGDLTADEVAGLVVSKLGERLADDEGGTPS